MISILKKPNVLLAPLVVTLWVLLTPSPTASAFYDPSLQRWINRDPLGEYGFETLRRAGETRLDNAANLYSFLENNPCDNVDAKGLKLWLCSRKTDWGIGNHVYFWTDSPPPGDGPTCAMNNSSGRGNPNVPNHPEKGPFGTPPDACEPVPGTDDPGIQATVWNCCNKTANTGTYKPWGNDCHNRVDDCLTPYGLPVPKHPRFGHPRVKPGKGSPPIFPPL